MESSLNTDEKNKSETKDHLFTPLENIFSYGLEALQVSARRIALSLLTEICLVIFVLSLILVAILFFWYGLAMGLGKALGGESWLGFVIIGGSFALGGLIYKRKLFFIKQNVWCTSNRKKLPDFSILLAIKKWVGENLIFATTMAALAGFGMSFKFAAKPKAKHAANTETTSANEKNHLKETLLALLIQFATSILEDIVHHFVSHENVTEHENALRQAQDKMDAEGGNQGIPHA